MVLFNLKHWKMQILSKGSTLNNRRPPRKTTKDTQQIYKSNKQKLLRQDFMQRVQWLWIFKLSEEDVKKILLSLDTSKAAGMDQIPAKLLRDGAEVLALSLRNIINLSIKLSTFPEECKITKLKPIFKKGAQGWSQKLPPYFPFATSINNNWTIISLSNWRLP